MKKIFLLLIISSFAIIAPCNSHAQGILGKIKDKAKQKANAKANSAAEDSAKSSDNNTSNSNDNNNSSSEKNNTETVPPTIKSYQNYDFRAGDKIIFEDNFATDADGEFPAHWDLNKGQAVVNKITGITAFLLTDGNYCQVAPRMTTKTYLTDNFSVEYDTYITNGAYGMIIYMYDKDNNDMSVHVNQSEAEWNYSNTKSFNGSLPADIANEIFLNKWHHIAIAYKNDQLKVYVDQYRVLTVPHCDLKPVKLECEGIGDQTNPIIFKDFKIADGASMNMLDAIMTKGKFITHGINFDVNSSDLKPESMGVIGDVVKYMQANTSLKLEIDGHTDSDGSDEANTKLSQARADAVKTAMVKAGIDASKLSTKGFGKSKPLGTNDTPEGKANNRRVEFVKV